MKFKNKTILITGASSGIGKDFALMVAKDGAHVILSARRKEQLDEVANLVKQNGGSAEVIVCDVTNTEQVRNLFLKAKENNKVIDLVLNNAGLGHIANIYQLTTSQIEQIIDVNIKGMIMVSKFASEVFVRQGSGHLIMTSSLAGLVTLPQWSVYVASKWAITGFADCIRAELEPKGIKVTTIHPGPVKTEFFDKEKANINLQELGSVIDVKVVSEEIYKASFSSKKRVLIPGSTKVYAFLSRYFPALVDFLIKRMTKEVKYNDITKEDEPEFDKSS